MSELAIERFPGGRRSGRAASGDDERALVARTLEGDAAAFAELVERHHASLLRLARAWGHDEAAVEAIVRGSWLAILDGLASFRFDSALRTWMMRIVAFRAMAQRDDRSSCRRDARAEDAGDDHPPERFDAGGRWIDPPLAWDERALAEADVTAAVEEAVSHLPPLERAVFTLRDVDGLGPEDTSAILGLGARRQLTLLPRARRRLRWALDQAIRDCAGRALACTG
jgi:RNA polymerase sigma-70 factor, ECF subfamily